VSAVLWAPRLAGPLDLRYDGGVYYTLGTSLADGRGYRLLNEPGAIEAVQYPPLLPMIVAAHQWALDTRDPARVGTALRWTWAALFFLYGAAVYALARQWLRPGWALVATLLVLLNLHLLWLSDALYAELPFACAAVLFLLVAERDDRRGLAALLGAVAYLLRTAGLALLVAWVLDALLQRRVLEAALRALLAAFPLVVWQAYIAEVEQGPDFVAPHYAYQRAPYQLYNVDYVSNLSYVDAFTPERGFATHRDLVARIGKNVLALPEALGESVSIRAEGPLRPVFRILEPAAPAPWSLGASRAGFALIGLVAAAGLAMLVLDGIRLPPLFWAASLGLVALVPWPSQLGRYLVPLAPLTAIGLMLVFANATRLANRFVQSATGAATGVLIAAQIVVLAVVFAERHQPVDPSQPGAPQRLFFYDAAWQRHDAALAWLGRTAPPDAVVATLTPHRLWLASGLHAVLPPFEPDPAEAARLLETVPVTYLVIDDLDFLDVARRYAEPVVRAHPDQWRLVYGGPDGGPRIYQRAAR
jgi:hypothetical protein